MRIKQISIFGLFGLFDHIIPLNLEERITIIHGLNGLGKTTILRLINKFFNNNMYNTDDVLNTIPFERFEIELDDNSKIEIFQKKSSVYENNVHLIYKLISSDGEEINIDENYNLIYKIIDEVPIHFIRTDRLFKHISTNKTSSFGYLASKDEERKTITVATVKVYSDDLLDIIEAKRSEAMDLAQELDRTFPIRLIKNTHQEILDKSQLYKKLTELTEQRKLLIELGILAKEDKKDLQKEEYFQKLFEQINENSIYALSIYVQDEEQKFAKLNELAKKIKLLIEIINKHYQYKKLSIDKKNGFIVDDGNSNKNIPLDVLSSGEQHILVLMYELLFKTKPNTLVLIDEPEISLHIAWQKHFLENLQKVAELVKIDFLLATHSPDIIQGYWDLTVCLKRLENK